MLKQPLIDWRLQPDRVAQGRSWDSGVHGVDQGERQAYERGIATWRRFPEERVRRDP